MTAVARCSRVRNYLDRKVYSRAPKYFRTFDEEHMVWRILVHPLYGGPDAGRVWYNTFSHYLMKEDTVTSFQRCHYEPCCFTQFVDSDDADDAHASGDARSVSVGSRDPPPYHPGWGGLARKLSP